MDRGAWGLLLLLGAGWGVGCGETRAPDGGPGLDATPADGADAGSIDLGDSGPIDLGFRDGGADGGFDAGPSPCWAAGATDFERYQGLLACLRDGGDSVGHRAAIAAFVAEVQAAGGFPIVDQGQAVFVYVRDPAYDTEDDNANAEDYAPDRRVAPIRVRGDFNGFAGDDLALSEEVERFFHGAFPLDVAGSDRWRYKLVAKSVAGDDVYFSDPLSRRYDFDQNGRISVVRGGQSRGHLERLGPFEGPGISPRSVEVYLPPGYEGGSAPLPVLYLHDGNNLFSRFQPRSAPVSWEADQVFEAEIGAGRVAPFLAVAVPNSSARFEEYTQTTDDIGGGPIGGQAAAYAAFLINVVKPAVDARFRTRPEAASTGVLGSSLGGLLSFYLGLSHPEVFGCVAGMSSTFAWGSFGLQQATLLDDYQAAPDLAARGQRYYLDSGGGPGTGCPADGVDNYCETVAMRDLLVARGISRFPDDPDASPLTPANLNIYHWWTPDAPHNEGSWHERVFRPLRLCFPPSP